VKNILITWELGGGIGHVSRLRPLVAELVARGHSVTVLSQNLPLARDVLGIAGVPLLQAPQLWPPEQEVRIPCTFADVLYNCGFANCDGLSATVAQWRRVYAELQPNLVLCDHSPTALLAARGLPFLSAAIGTGFTIPPDLTPLPSLRSSVPEPSWAAEVEQIVLNHMNHAIHESKAPPLSNVAHIYTDVRKYLLTLRELDHYPQRPNAKYWRPLAASGSAAGPWPAAQRARILVYLKYESNALPLLQRLSDSPDSYLCYVPGISDVEVTLACRPNLTITRRPLDILQLCNEADAAVLNGGHGAVAQFLLAGKPVLVLPKSLEQQITGERIAQLGAGHVLPLNATHDAAISLEALIEDSRFAEAAAALAAKYDRQSIQEAVAALADDLENAAA
jgi:UDP:flavonoid glycosyltransferase YjiC (YdhE family)